MQERVGTGRDRLPAGGSWEGQKFCDQQAGDGDDVVTTRECYTYQRAVTCELRRCQEASIRVALPLGITRAVHVKLLFL